MKTRLFAIALMACAALLFSSAALAKDVSHESGNIIVPVPDDWEAGFEDKDVLSVYTPVEGVFALFWATPPEKLEECVDNLLDKLREVASDIVCESDCEAMEVAINGIPVLLISGAGKIDDMQIAWIGAVLGANAEMPIVMALVIDANQITTYEAPLKAMLEGIKPIDPKKVMK